MQMLEYIRAIKHYFRDFYGFKPDREVDGEPCFAIPDGIYPMELEGKIDNVSITDDRIHCCKFVKVLDKKLVARGKKAAKAYNKGKK